MILTDWEQWKTWSNDWQVLPFLTKHVLKNGTRVPEWQEVWRGAGPYHFVLESAKGGRYTYFGRTPCSVLSGKDGTASVTELPTGTRRLLRGDPLPVVKQWLGAHRAPRVAGGPPFCGGAVGFFSYDVARSLERLPVWSRDDLGLPDYFFLQVREIWIVDHEESSVYCAYITCMDSPGIPGNPVSPMSDEEAVKSLYEHALSHTEYMKAEWDRFVGSAAVHEKSKRRMEQFAAFARADQMWMNVDEMDEIVRHFPKTDFMEAVRRIQTYISQGDVFQVNLSLRQSRPLHVPPAELYEWLRLLNPSPYMGYLGGGDFQLVSGSPELLVKLAQGVVYARPIAGTRRRGKDDPDEARMRHELLTNEKERAEHVMLVDLIRNDLGKISKYGTVAVEDFMVIEAYSHVMHLVSGVSGQLAAGKDGFDVLAAVFPGGTITGAPKIRTMEIIEELEPVRRGPYTGSLGWIDYSGDLEFNILIRTLVAVDGVGHIQAGAGIVIDSDPEREYKESLNKAKALWKAIQYGEMAEKADPLRDEEECT